MRSVPEEVTTLISDLEHFLNDGLKAENLSKKAKEKREALAKRIRDVRLRYVDDSEKEEEADSNNDRESLQSERTDKDDDTYEGAQQSPPVAAQDLTSVFKAGYLEKRRKDHSFFGTEWQKRWCALSHHTFYYYGSEKDKQQKGEFSIDGYSVKMINTLRKDSKKDCCFEICAPEKRVYQFCASSVKEAEDWVQQIDFVLRDLTGVIPEEEYEQEMYDDVGAPVQPIDEDIYEELPGLTSHYFIMYSSVDKATDYQNYYQGLWDCTGDQTDELTFKRGDPIYILSKEYQNYGWWVGEKNGNIGIVPKDYLMQLYIL
uniref:Src kinase-associated phosphoprotein 2 n=1 Tax=Cynoglossus semilaevis TaxID=244447 RepID=A0A3P8UZX1_CYNSE